MNLENVDIASLPSKDVDYILVWTCEHGTELNILTGEYVVRFCDCYAIKARSESS